MSSTKIGRQFLNFVSGTSPTAVLLPASNTNGAYIRTGTITASNTGAASSFILVVDTAAPSGITDTSKRVIFNALVNAGTCANFVLPYELEVPAGWGIWAVSATASWGVGITFDTLA